MKKFRKWSLSQQNHVTQSYKRGKSSGETIHLYGLEVLASTINGAICKRIIFHLVRGCTYQIPVYLQGRQFVRNVFGFPEKRVYLKMKNMLSGEQTYFIFELKLFKVMLVVQASKCEVTKVVSHVQMKGEKIPTTCISIFLICIFSDIFSKGDNLCDSCLFSPLQKWRNGDRVGFR